jgi:hypothetical protein
MLVSTMRVMLLGDAPSMRNGSRSYNVVILDDRNTLLTHIV